MHQAEKFRKMLYYWRNLTFIGFFHLSSQFFFKDRILLLLFLFWKADMEFQNIYTWFNKVLKLFAISHLLPKNSIKNSWWFAILFYSKIKYVATLLKSNVILILKSDWYVICIYPKVTAKFFCMNKSIIT